MTLRTDAHFPTATEGLTNARTRIVGTRAGFLADLIVTLVRVARSVRATASRAFASVASVVTPVGWAFAIFVPLALAVGYRLNWIELVVAGFASAVLILVAMIYLIGRTAVELELTIPHDRVVVGESATGEVIVSNPRRRRTLGVTVEIPIGHGLVELAVPSLASQDTSVQHFSVPTSHRGVITVGPTRTVRADPIGLVRREVVLSGMTELFIHPRTIGIPSMSTGLVKDLEGNPTRDVSNSDIAFHALREYLPGDERRHIHWKSTAKTGTYMVRQFEETRRSHVIIALSLAGSDYATAAEFELAVSVAGSLGVRAIRDLRDVAVIVGEKTPEFAKRRVLAIKALSTRSRSRLLDELAVVEKADTALAAVDVCRVAGAQLDGVSLAFVICGSTVTPTQLRAASTKFPLGVEVIAVVCDQETVPGLRSAAGLSILTIGYLEDLRASLSKARAL